MAVAMEFINVIVRIDAIRKKFSGGWQGFLQDFDGRIGSIGWFDDHLYREGAMNPQDTKRLVEQWKGLGFDVYREDNGQPVEWLDICVAESLFGSSLKCDWLDFTDDRHAAYLAGTAPGEIITRDHFADFNWINWLREHG